MKVEKWKDKVIDDGQMVRVLKTKNVYDVTHTTLEREGGQIRKINEDEYVVVETGEIKQFEKTEYRSESVKSLRKTFRDLRNRINANFGGEENELFITLTFREHVTDPKRLYREFENFIKRFRYRFTEGCKKPFYSDDEKNVVISENKKDGVPVVSRIEYINVIEPHASGCWHCHALLRFEDLKSIKILNRFDKKTKQPIDAPLFKIWKNGYVNIQGMKDNDNVGAYLSAYLTDMDIEEFVELDESKIGQGFDVEQLKENIRKKYEEKYKERLTERKEKKILKGMRLKFYNHYTKIFRCSSGIVVPEIEDMMYGEFKEKIGLGEPDRKKTIKIDNGLNFDYITYEQYNIKRNKKTVE